MGKDQDPKRYRRPTLPIGTPVRRGMNLHKTSQEVEKDPYAAKLAPQPHVSVALGLSNVKPRALRPS